MEGGAIDVGCSMASMVDLARAQGTAESVPVRVGLASRCTLAHPRRRKSAPVLACEVKVVQPESPHGNAKDAAKEACNCPQDRRGLEALRPWHVCMSSARRSVLPVLADERLAYIVDLIDVVGEFVKCDGGRDEAETAGVQERKDEKLVVGPPLIVKRGQASARGARQSSQTGAPRKSRVAGLQRNLLRAMGSDDPSSVRIGDTKSSDGPGPASEHYTVDQRTIKKLAWT